MAGTKVLTPTGERNIETLKVGELVLACDPERGIVSLVRLQLHWIVKFLQILYKSRRLSGILR